MKKIISFAVIAAMLVCHLSSCALSNEQGSINETKDESLAETALNEYGKIPINELPKKYPSDIAEKNGDYMDIHGVIFNGHLFDDFFEKVEKNEEAYLRKVSYTVEGDPIIHDFYYDTAKFNVTIDTTRDKFGPQAIEEVTFKYLQIFDMNGYLYFMVTNLEPTEELYPKFPADGSADDSIIVKFIGELERKN